MADRAVNFDIKVRAIDEASNVFQKIGSNLKKETSGSFKNASDTLSQKGIKGVGGGADSGRFKLNFEDAVYRGMSRALKESGKIFGRGGYGIGRGGYGGGGETDSQRMGGIVGSIGKVFDKIGAAIGSLKIMGNSVGLIPSLPFRAIGMFGGLAKGALNMVSSVGQDYQQRIMEQAQLSGVKGIGIVRRAVGGGFTETRLSGGGKMGDVSDIGNYYKAEEAKMKAKESEVNKFGAKSPEDLTDIREYKERQSLRLKKGLVMPIGSVGDYLGKSSVKTPQEKERFEREMSWRKDTEEIYRQINQSRKNPTTYGMGSASSKERETNESYLRGQELQLQKLYQMRMQGKKFAITPNYTGKTAAMRGYGGFTVDGVSKDSIDAFNAANDIDTNRKRAIVQERLGSTKYGREQMYKKYAEKRIAYEQGKTASKDINVGGGAWQTYGGANQFKQETGNFNVDYRLDALRGKFDFNYSRYGLNAAGLQRALFARQRAGGAMTRLGTGENSELALTRYLGYGMSTGIGAEQGAYLGGQFERYQLGQAQFGKQGTKLGEGVESAQANFRAAAVYGRQAGYTGAANPEFLTQMIQAVKSGVEKGMTVSGGVIAKQAAHFAVIAKESGMGKEAGMTMMSSISAAGESASKLGESPTDNILFQAVYQKMSGKTEAERLTKTQLFLENPQNNVLKMQYLSEFYKGTLGMSDVETRIAFQRTLGTGVKQSALAAGYRLDEETGEMKYDPSVFQTRPLKAGIGEEYSEIDKESAQRVLTQQNKQEAYKLRRGGVVEKMSDMDLQVSETMLRLLNNFEQPIQKIVGVLGSFISKMSEVVQYLGNASEKLMGGNEKIGKGLSAVESADLAKQMSEKGG